MTKFVFVKDCMDRATRLKRLHYRAHHRGTKEADMIIGGFFDAHSADWSEDQIVWFEALMDEEDVEIMGWAIGSMSPPARVAGSMMQAMQTLDYIVVPK
jgi:antitoxin CptB